MAVQTAGIISESLAYRADVDGLRAIAVLCVVAFHAFPNLLSGGFVGVDVFFVISGFLISSIIATELDNGRFGFIGFYSRRIRRIFPTLFLLQMACLVVGWQVLLANEFGQLGQHVVAGAGFSSNLLLWVQSGYFDTASEFKPLLHLWSLGIEEQFYILLPLLMWLCHRFRIRFAYVAVVLFLTSFAWNIALVGKDPVSAFYLPHCRVWELLAGTLLALSARNYSGGQYQVLHKYREPAAMLGLLLLCLGLLVLDKEYLFPGWWAVLPVLGAALLLCAQGSWINDHVLSQRVLVSVGLISYPLYLWHWPLLSFGRIVTGGALTVEVRLALVAAATLLAHLTYWCWERHLRHRGNKSAIALLFLVAIAGLLGWNVYSRDGLDFRYREMIKQPAQMQRDFTKWEEKGMYPKGVCDPDFIYPNSHICLPSGTGVRPDTVVYGDSHAFHAYWGISRSLERAGHTVKLIGRGGCAFGLYQSGSDCEQTFERQLKWMSTDTTVRNIFIVHRLVISNEMSDADVQNYRQRMEQLLGTLLRQEKHVVLFYSVPESRMNPALCEGQLPFGRKADLSGCNFPLSRELEHQRSDRTLVADLQKEYPTLEVFDPSDVLCKSGICQTVIDGRANWMDDNHISESASYVQGDAVAKLTHLR